MFLFRIGTMATEVQFKLNGKATTLSSDPARSLLEVLREDLDLTGTKYGCGEGACRACTVLMDGKPVQSCLTRIESVSGKSIETIEGLGDGENLHPIQEAFLSKEAMQCGYCVPGMIMTTAGLLRANPSPDRDEIVEALNGNLCRCCGYGNLLAAIEKAAKHASAP